LLQEFQFRHGWQLKIKAWGEVQAIGAVISKGRALAVSNGSCKKGWLLQHGPYKERQLPIKSLGHALSQGPLKTIVLFEVNLWVS